jgi:co-chaperonin GroES (HSP10)
MRVIGTMVLIEQTMTKKTSAIIMTDGNKEQSFDTKFKIVGLGGKCPNEREDTYEGIKVGDEPIFSTHVVFHGAKRISEVKAKNGRDVESAVIHTMVDYADIIAIEND